jgi:hypothetical protein
LREINPDECPEGGSRKVDAVYVLALRKLGIKAGQVEIMMADEM